MKTKKLVLSALFLALGMILPMITMQIPAVGNMLLPMHIPVLLCGFLCGAPYGAAVGFVTPLLRSALFGMPPMMPVAVAMAVELMVYGLVCGILYGLLQRKKGRIYITLLVTMAAGRVVWGAVTYLLYTLMGSTFTWEMFAAQAFFNAIPGIMVQLIVIPVIVTALEKSDWKGIQNEG